MRRKTKPPNDDRLVPWEDRPISRERWQRHRDWMMATEGPGQRPQKWWLYEKGRKRPENETQTLYAMGELRGAELARLMEWWRDAYKDAYEVFHGRPLRDDQKNAGRAASISRLPQCAA